MTMLDRMRRHQSWLKWSLGLVVLAFIVFYIPDFVGQRTPVGGRTGATAREVVAEIAKIERAKLSPADCTPFSLKIFCRPYRLIGETSSASPYGSRRAPLKTCSDEIWMRRPLRCRASCAS